MFDHTSHVRVTEWAARVPEVMVSDLPHRLDVSTRVFGFTLHGTRPGFASLSVGRVPWVLEQAHADQAWLTGLLDQPYGRGINIQLAVPDLDALHARVLAPACPMDVPLTTATSIEGNTPHTQRQLPVQVPVQDPDGDLLRFAD